MPPLFYVANDFLFSLLSLLSKVSKSGILSPPLFIFFLTRYDSRNDCMVCNSLRERKDGISPFEGGKR